MSTIERLKEIDSILKAESWYSCDYHALPKTWVDLGKALPKLLALVEAADNLFENRLVEDSPEMDALYEAYKACVE